MMITWRNGKRIMIDDDGNETIIGSVKIRIQHDDTCMCVECLG